MINAPAKEEYLIALHDLEVAVNNYNSALTLGSSPVAEVDALGKVFQAKRKSLYDLKN
jgi:hypothetical protein